MSRWALTTEQFISTKRVAGYKVQPVRHLGITYTLRRKSDGPNICHYALTAEEKDGKILWETVYFTNTYNDSLEIDVQDILPVDLSIDGEYIVIKHERHTDTEGIYMLDRETGRIQR